MLPIEWFFRAAKRRPDAVALADGDQEFTFGELAAKVWACAERLVQMDPTPRSRVGICAGNSISHIIALLAVMASGKIWAPFNPKNGDAELNRIAVFTGATVCFADEINRGRIKNITARNLDDFVRGSGSTRPPSRNPCGDHGNLADDSLRNIQAIKFTGGSTGTPKGVLQSFRNWMTSAVTLMNCLDLTCADRLLLVGPVTHGTSVFLLPILASGGRIVLPASTSPPDVLDAIEIGKATIVFATPTFIYALSAEQEVRPRRMTSLRFLVYGGAGMRLEKIVEAQRLFAGRLATSYGQTEAPLVATFLSPQELRDPGRMASVGRATLMTEVAIRDESGAFMPEGVEGEVCLRGDLLSEGYWQMPDATAKALDGGWLRTGDIGVLDDEGYLYLRGRRDDMIITGGFNVYPADVEAVLGAHPAVFDCVVLGVPDERWGSAVHAAVQLRGGVHVDAATLIAFVKAELGSVKAPKSVHFYENLPRSPVGKIAKTEILNDVRQCR